MGASGWSDLPSAGTALTFTAVKTSAYTALNGDMVRCDVSGGAFTVTVPASPSAGWRFGVILTTEASGQANALSVSAGSGPHDNKLYCQGDYIVYQYDGSAWQTVNCYLKPHTCSVSLSADITTNSAGVTKKVTWDTKTFDVGGIFDAVTNNYATIRRAGKYLVTINLRPINSTGADKYYRGEVRLNGAAKCSIGGAWVSLASSNNMFVNGSLILNCAAGDTIQSNFLAENANVGVSHSADDANMTISELR